MRRGMITGVTPEKAVANVIKALGKGVLKIMSKMGISTVVLLRRRAGVRGGRPQPGLRRRSTSPAPPVEARRRRHRRHRGREPAPARGRVPRRTPPSRAHERLATGGEYQWRRDGSPHLFNPDTVFRLQHSTRTRRYDIFREYTQLVDDAGREPDDPARAVRAAHRHPARRCRSTRSSRSRRSSSASPPAR